MEVSSLQREAVQIAKQESAPRDEEKREIKADSEKKELARAERDKLEVGSEFSATA